MRRAARGCGGSCAMRGGSCSVFGGDRGVRSGSGPVFLGKYVKASAAKIGSFSVARRARGEHQDHGRRDPAFARKSRATRFLRVHSPKHHAGTRRGDAPRSARSRRRTRSLGLGLPSQRDRGSGGAPARVYASPRVGYAAAPSRSVAGRRQVDLTRGSPRPWQASLTPTSWSTRRTATRK